jgi:hypothetical protein
MTFYQIDLDSLNQKHTWRILWLISGLGSLVGPSLMPNQMCY